jgi:hypothetical protein
MDEQLRKELMKDPVLTYLLIFYIRPMRDKARRVRKMFAKTPRVRLRVR